MTELKCPKCNGSNVKFLYKMEGETYYGCFNLLCHGSTFTVKEEKVNKS